MIPDQWLGRVVCLLWSFLWDCWTQICGSLPVCPSIISPAQQYRTFLLCSLTLFPIPPKTHLFCMGRGWLSLSEQWNIMILPTEKRQTISSDIWDLTTYFFFFAGIIFFFKWAVFSSKSIFLRKVLACEMVQGESSPCSGTLEGYMWWQRKTTDSAKIYVE